MFCFVLKFANIVSWISMNIFIFCDIKIKVECEIVDLTGYLHCLRISWNSILLHFGKTWKEIHLGMLFVVVQSLNYGWLFVTRWTAARPAPLSSTISWSLLKFMSIESVMLSNHLILCCPLFLLPSIFPSITVFSHELALCIRYPEIKPWKRLWKRTLYV